jgi:hypothetical protein
MCRGLARRSQVVSGSFGHSRSSVTIDTYAHVLLAQERAVADKMDAIFW